jgi:hypothetical protein
VQNTQKVDIKVPSHGPSYLLLSSWAHIKNHTPSNICTFYTKIHYTNAQSYNDVPENNVSVLDLCGERSPGMSLVQMLMVIGEVEAGLALGPEE